MKPVTLFVIGLFCLFTLGHVLRAAFGVEVTVGELRIPIWASAVAAVFFAAVALLLWREARG